MITYHAKDVGRDGWRSRRAAASSRSRKHGAAVPLDELDKQLLNLMQGAFPLEPRPYARVAELAEVDRGRGARAASSS